MTANEKKVSDYCDKISDQHAGDCDQECIISGLCMKCAGDFSEKYDKDVAFADVAAQELDKKHADDVANSVLVEYYKIQLEQACKEIASLNEMNKILAESIKNLSANR